MTKGWIYRLSGVIALALVLHNPVLAAEWAIYQDGFQMPPLLGSDYTGTASTTVSRANPRSLLTGDGDSTLVGTKAYLSNDRRQTTEFGLYYGELTESLEPQAMNLDPKASDSEELIGPAGVFVRLRF